VTKSNSVIAPTGVCVTASDIASFVCGRYISAFATALLIQGTRTAAKRHKGLPHLLSLGTMIAHKTIATRAFSRQRGLSSNTGVAPRVAPTSSRRVQCRPVAFQDNVQAAVAATKKQNASTAAASSGRAIRMPTIELITAAVSIQAQTQQFERFAGRSAMVSVCVSS
jgi:hypothetical protein